MQLLPLRFFRASKKRPHRRVLEGSHRTLQEHWQKTLRPERLPFLPRTHGLTPQPQPGGRTSCDAGTEGIPELDQKPWLDQKPTVHPR